MSERVFPHCYHEIYCWQSCCTISTYFASQSVWCVKQAWFIEENNITTIVAFGTLGPGFFTHHPLLFKYVFKNIWCVPLKDSDSENYNKVLKRKWGDILLITNISGEKGHHASCIFSAWFPHQTCCQWDGERSYPYTCQTFLKSLFCYYLSNLSLTDD